METVTLHTCNLLWIHGPHPCHEVRKALWLPLEEAPRKLAFGGERQMARRAMKYLESQDELSR